MRLLIAGWHGQLATALVEQLAARTDVDAFAVGRPALDICEMPTIQRAMSDVRPTVIINTAAYTAVDQAESDSERAYALNRDGAGLLARAAAARNIPIIHISTDYVFDGLKDQPYSELDLPAPQNIYGKSKLAGEQAVAEANERHIIVRTAWVLSAKGKNFLRTMLALASKQDTVHVVSDQWGNPTYAPHLADVILSLAAEISPNVDASRHDGTSPWGIYHAAGSGTTTWAGLAEAIFAQSRIAGGPFADVVPIDTATYPTAAARPANSMLECTKLADTFGLKLPDWHEGVKSGVIRAIELGDASASN